MDVPLYGHFAVYRLSLTFSVHIMTPFFFFEADAAPLQVDMHLRHPASRDPRLSNQLCNVFFYIFERGSYAAKKVK